MSSSVKQQLAALANAGGSPKDQADRYNCFISVNWYF